MDLRTHTGGCHCGTVAFEVDAPAQLRVQRCNCSMCRISGYEHLIVPASCFRLLRGGQQLQTYTFNTGVARHLFCQTCGVKSFYVPRSNPDGYSINLRCLNRDQVEAVEYEDFDGENWEVGGAALAGLSRE